MIVGCGLIGGSIGLALRAAGWHVSGVDRDPRLAARAVAVGAVDVAGSDSRADITFVCTPVSAVPAAVAEALATGPGVVTDVGSVKRTIVEAVRDPRFVGGHPMAGSEQEGVDGADAALFQGSTWVLTPTSSTDPDAFARVRNVVTSLGADVVAVAPDRHDEIVAVVSHVPHLSAAALMVLADDAATQHGTLLRLAAGGFRDMTRIAAGSPDIWPDICADNSVAICAALDELVERLSTLRGVVASGDRGALVELLSRARAARAHLPARAATRPETLTEVRVPVPDRPGVLAEVTTLAGELGVDIFDLEIRHSAEGQRGVVLLVVDADRADLVRGALFGRGYRPTTRRLS